MRYRQSKALVVSSWPILGAHPKVVVRICRRRLCDCVLDWECMLLGMDHTRPPLFQCLELEQKVTVTLRAHVLVIVRVVNELSPRCRSWNKIPKSKIHNPTSPLLLFANLHTLKCLSADSPSRPPPPFLFLTIIFCVFGYLLLSFLLILNISLSHS